MNPQEGIGCPSAPLRRGPDELEFGVQGTMLKVAPVSTKYLSLVNSAVRKISPALAGKCIAVAVTCVGMAVELKGVLWQFSFPTKHRVKNTCEPCWCINCHCHGFEKNRSQGGKGGSFWNGHCRSICRLASRC
jgi:hypothetical protein